MTLHPEEQAPLGEVPDDLRIRLLEPQAGQEAGLLAEGPVGPHRMHHGQIHPTAYLQVVCAEGRGQVHDARAVLGRDEVARHHPVTVLAREIEPSIGGLVVGSEELGALEPLDDLQVFLIAQHGLQAALRQDQDGRTLADGDVVQGRVDGGSGVPGQCPGGGGPDQQAGLVRQTQGLGIPQREADENRRVLDVLIAQADLGGGERRPATGAEGNDLVAQVEQVLLPQALEGPPDALDVVVGHRHVGVVQIHPEGNPFGHAPPGAFIGHHRLPALPVEGLDPVGLDRLLAREAQAFLHLDLHRQTVTIPARLAADPEASHRLVAREQVLVGSGLDMVDSRIAVGGGRALVEDELRGSLTGLQRLLEHTLFQPGLQDLLLDLGEGGAGVDSLKPGLHGDLLEKKKRPLRRLGRRPFPGGPPTPGLESALQGSIETLVVRTVAPPDWAAVPGASQRIRAIWFLEEPGAVYLAWPSSRTSRSPGPSRCQLSGVSRGRLRTRARKTTFCPGFTTLVAGESSIRGRSSEAT